LGAGCGEGFEAVGGLFHTTPNLAYGDFGGIDSKLFSAVSVFHIYSPQIAALSSPNKNRCGKHGQQERACHKAIQRSVCFVPLCAVSRVHFGKARRDAKSCILHKQRVYAVVPHSRAHRSASSNAHRLGFLRRYRARTGRP
jgi:hypothetical protein